MLNNLSIKSRLIFVIGLLSFLLVAIGGIGMYSLHANNQALQRVWERADRLGQLEHIIALVTTNQVKIAESVTGQLIPFPENFELTEKRVAEVKRSIETIEKDWKAYLAGMNDEEELKLAKSFDDKRRA